MDLYCGLDAVQLLYCDRSQQRAELGQSGVVFVAPPDRYHDGIVALPHYGIVAGIQQYHSAEISPDPLRILIQYVVPLDKIWSTQTA